MNTQALRLRAITTVAAGVAGFAVLAGAVGGAGLAHASTNDGPWPEPPSCSNETGACSSIEDIIAYDCYFEQDYESPFNFCDDPFEEFQMQKEPGLVAPVPGGDPAPARLVLPTVRR